MPTTSSAGQLLHPKLTGTLDEDPNRSHEGQILYNGFTQIHVLDNVPCRILLDKIQILTLSHEEITLHTSSF